ncbi:MAG: hypothetical protein R2739_05710 [Chitinophagales bacterium]|nr:hypothetical protein [Bacteroidota bacterium]
MDSTKKFQEAFDVLVKDLNAKVEEVRSNILNLKADVKVQVDGQKENLQEYGEKIKGRITQIVDIDKVRANVLAEAENLVDDTKIRLEKVFQFINQQVNVGEKRAKKAASSFSKKAEAFTDEIEEDVKKASKDLQKNITKVSNKAEENFKKVKKQVDTQVEKVSKEVKATVAKAKKEVEAKKAPAKKAATPAKKAPAKKAASKTAKAPAKKAAAKKTTK